MNKTQVIASIRSDLMFDNDWMSYADAQQAAIELVEYEDSLLNDDGLWSDEDEYEL